MARDYSNIYNIKDFMLNDITSKYFNIDDISLNNVGLYGMINDACSTVAEDTMRVTTRYITELIPGQSKLPEFIYANAANYGISDIFATCAKCKALLFIKEYDVINNGIVDGRYSDYTIDSDLLVYIDDVPFSIPNDIKIKSTYYNGSYNHRCYWDSIYTNSCVDNDLPYIKCAKTKIQGETDPYLVIAVTLYQYERKRTVESIITNTVLNIPYIDVPFENYLCNFEVIYTPPGGTPVQLHKIMNNASPLTSPFIFYDLQDEQTLRLLFSNDDRYFTPLYGSQIEILMYECLGEKGSFPLYKGDNIYVSPKSEDYTLGYNNTIPMFCVMNSESKYGKNTYTLDEIKQLTNRYQVTVESITTENDLAKYFETYTSLYNTVAKIIRVRDDFANRMYSCYTRLKDDENIFPTNTVNIKLNVSDVPNNTSPYQNKIFIPAGTRLGYIGNSIDDCKIIKDEDVIESEPYYSSLGLTVIDKVDNTIGIYMNSINDTIPIIYEYVNDNSLFQFIVKQLTVSRSAINGENGYKFSITLIPTDLSLVDTSLEPLDDEYAGDEQSDTDTSGNIVINISKLKLFIFVDTMGGHYIEMNYVKMDDSLIEPGYTFECTVTTDDVINSENINLTNLTYSPNQQIQDCYTAMENPPIHIIVSYDEGSNIKQGHDYKDLIPDIETFTICNIFKPEEDSLYFSYPLELIRPILEFVPDDKDSNGYSIDIYSMPVVGYDFIKNDDNLAKFLERLNTQHDYLQEGLITSNFGIYLRFFNTYGRSRIFTITSGALLNRVNCSISLSLKFKESIEAESYLNEIKLTIKEYIESLNPNYNDGTQGINSIKLSLISTLLHEKFSNVIDFIIMGSINGYDTNIQTIIMSKDLTDKKNIDLYPEFLTIDMKDIDITVL